MNGKNIITSDKLIPSIPVCCFFIEMYSLYCCRISKGIIRKYHKIIDKPRCLAMTKSLADRIFDSYIYSCCVISFKNVLLSRFENMGRSILAPGFIISLRSFPGCFSFHHLSPYLFLMYISSSAALTAASR